VGALGQGTVTLGSPVGTDNNWACVVYCQNYWEYCTGDATCNADLANLIACNRNSCGVDLGTEGTTGFKDSDSLNIGDDADTLDFARCSDSTCCNPGTTDGKLW